MHKIKELLFPLAQLLHHSDCPVLLSYCTKVDNMDLCWIVLLDNCIVILNHKKCWIIIYTSWTKRREAHHRTWTKAGPYQHMPGLCHIPGLPLVCWHCLCAWTRAAYRMPTNRGSATPTTSQQSRAHSKTWKYIQTYDLRKVKIMFTLKRFLFYANCIL